MASKHDFRVIWWIVLLVIDTYRRTKVICYPVNHTGSNPPNEPKTKVIVVIPARYDSVRLPGKPLLEIAGKPMICWVAERARAARNVQQVLVATDDERVLHAAEAAGHSAVLSKRVHATGTDRIAEVVESIDGAEIIVNVQGDEPLIEAETIERAVDELANSGPEIGIVTTWEPIEDPNDVTNPDVVKIVVGDDGSAIYFSRSPVPYARDAVRKYGSLEIALRSDETCLKSFRKHTGLYVYRREVLLNMSRWQPTNLEKLESLEQLRAMENGVRIKAIRAAAASIGVDTAADLERVRSILEARHLETSSC